MATPFIIALDAMGGDKAPDMVIEGAFLARERLPHVNFLIFGDEQKLRPLLAKFPRLQTGVTIHHTPDIIAADTKPSVAVRAGRNSSMRLAIDSVAEGKAACVVSAGNTGALMALAKLVLKTLPGIDRPAIGSFLPSIRGETVLLDLGANIECSAQNLVQFALLGSVFARCVLGILSPTVGILNIGSEEMKGHEEVKSAAALLKQIPLPGSFHGFVEGNDIAAGTVDVIATDGFTGNIALKTAEGTAKFYAEFLRRTFQSSWITKLAYLMIRPALRQLKARTDPRRYNGAMFLGLQGVCVKSHGGTDAEGFANAIAVAADLVQYGFNDKIKEEIARLTEAIAQVETKATTS